MRRARIFREVGAVTLSLGSLVFVAFGGARLAVATDYPPGDHHGEDLILQDGDRIWGADQRDCL